MCCLVLLPIEQPPHKPVIVPSAALFSVRYYSCIDMRRVCICTHTLTFSNAQDTCAHKGSDAQTRGGRRACRICRGRHADTQGSPCRFCVHGGGQRNSRACSLHHTDGRERSSHISRRRRVRQRPRCGRRQRLGHGQRRRLLQQGRRARARRIRGAREARDQRIVRPGRLAFVHPASR